MPHPVLIRATLPSQQLSSRFSKLLCAERVLDLKHKTIANSAAKPSSAELSMSQKERPRETAGNSEEYRFLTLVPVTPCIALFLGADSDRAFLCCYMGNRVSGILQQEWLTFIALPLS